MTTMAIAIINYNTCDHLRGCLESMATERPAEVVVVDNASTDGSADMIRAKYPSVRLLANKVNVGYGAAGNQAIAACAADYILLLNSDTWLQPGTLQALTHYLDQHSQVAVVGPRLLNPDGTLQRSCFASPTPLHYLLNENWLAQKVGTLPILRERFLVDWPHTEVKAVPWVLGAALAIRRAAFEEVDGFDPSFFMYFEEVDLCYRLQTAGWTSHFLPDATTIHIGGASTVQQRARMTVQLYQSLFHFYDQHYAPKKKVQIRWVLSYIMLRNTVRDWLRLQRAKEDAVRETLQDNVRIWQSILKGMWAR